MKLLFAFIMEKAPAERPARQAALFRELATVIGSAAQAETLLDLANDCEERAALEQRIEAKQRELRFDLGEPDGNGGAQS